MPNIKSSIRSVKTDAERRAQNFSLKSTIKTKSRKLTENAQAGKTEEANIQLTKASCLIDKAAQKGILHKNNAARKKSRLAKQVNNIAK